MRRFFITWFGIQLLCWLVLGLLFAPVVPGGWLAVLALAVLVTLPVRVLMRGFRGERYPGKGTRLFVLRPFWYTQLVLPLAGAAGVLGALVGALVGDAGAGGRTGVALLLALALLGFGAGYVGARRLVVRRFVARSPLLPPAFEGVRVVQLSDLHIGPHTPKRRLARIARLVREARPDLVAITGDMIDDHAPDVEEFVAGLGTFEAPLGVFAIAGNHDVYAGWIEVRRRFEAHGMDVVVNEARAIARDGTRIALVGVGDPAGRGARGPDSPAPDIDRALADAARRVPDAGYVLALAHNPALWPALAARGVALTLSGHTHWGQLAVPGLGWSLASPFLEHAMGSYVEGTSVLYVHPGTGYWGLPFRLGTPAEIGIVTLSRGEAGFSVI